MWFDEYKIDGLRWDSTVNIRAYNNGAEVNPDGERMLHRLAKMIRQEYPGKISVAEDSVGDPRFDSSWEYAFHHGDGGGVVPQLVNSVSAASSTPKITMRPGGSTASGASSPMSTRTSRTVWWRGAKRLSRP
jgi:hypothetical protein